MQVKNSITLCRGRVWNEADRFPCPTNYRNKTRYKVWHFFDIGVHKRAPRHSFWIATMLCLWDVAKKNTNNAGSKYFEMETILGSVWALLFSSSFGEVGLYPVWTDIVVLLVLLSEGKYGKITTSKESGIVNSSALCYLEKMPDSSWYIISVRNIF